MVARKPLDDDDDEICTIDKIIFESEFLPVTLNEGRDRHSSSILYPNGNSKINDEAEPRNKRSVTNKYIIKSRFIPIYFKTLITYDFCI